MSCNISSSIKTSACCIKPLPPLAAGGLLRLLKTISSGLSGRGRSAFTAELRFCRSASRCASASSSRRLSASAASSSSGCSEREASSCGISGIDISTSFEGAGKLFSCCLMPIFCCSFLSFTGIGSSAMSSSTWLSASPSRNAAPELLAGVAGVIPPVSALAGVAPPGVMPGVAPGVRPYGVMPRACSTIKFGVMLTFCRLGNAPVKSLSFIDGLLSPYRGVCIAFLEIAFCASIRTVFCCLGVR
mmetsp:Transcript_6370/g.15371  ORF Transcript_6370/g.15371 Transcript_6370/m.15371 type:complete len:245 (-) Transcript_6370:1113-1847(-)